MERERPRIEVDLGHPRCPYCKDQVLPGDRKVACDACMSWHHADCWEEYGRCAACRGTAVAGRDPEDDPEEWEPEPAEEVHPSQPVLDEPLEAYHDTHGVVFVLILIVAILALGAPVGLLLLFGR